ncbi:MAG TPA: protoglobin domain-containing protein, partial [Verrucomicrobiae bacterium]|nr:protoglobin domain-containing protein [Verrucomicrobiae bacterium]
MMNDSAPPLPPESSPDDQQRYDLQRRLAFLELSEQDAERLRALAPLFESRERDFVDHFYRHLFTFPDTARFLNDEQLIKRLKEYQ